MGFEISKAAREKIYTKVALMAPSGGGKTYGALRLATGMIQEIKKTTNKNAKVLMANTEKARGRYYANEFEYDIVDISPPHNPEKYVELINFAVSEGYDVLIIDSTSHEWEGKGGCLELQQQAGGTYQAWGKVTPRHNAFIDAIADSQIHIIATMRGKDQYEMNTDDRGKKSVQKLGVGAKQRDGFEYEFTCTFLIDQKTNMAEPQKDNTHIFENDVATLLSEEHGKKIIKWANTSKIEPKKIDVETSETNQNLNAIKKEIILICTEKSKTKRPEVTELCKKIIKTSPNPNAIKDLETAQTLLRELKEIV